MQQAGSWRLPSSEAIDGAARPDVDPSTAQRRGGGDRLLEIVESHDLALEPAESLEAQRLKPFRPMITSMPLVTGARLGHYEILGALGEGGMGEVYRARDPRLDREVAIKWIVERK